MEENQLSPEELQQLARYASRRLGMTPEQIAAAVNEGGLSALSEKMSDRENQRLGDFLKDPEKARQLMAMPEVQQLIRQLLNGG